jgi:hypothetical protein
MLAKPRLHGELAASGARRRHCFKALLFGRRHEAWAGCSFYAGEHRLALGWVPSRCRAADDGPRLGAGAWCGEPISGLGGRSPSSGRLALGWVPTHHCCTGGRCTGVVGAAATCLSADSRQNGLLPWEPGGEPTTMQVVGCSVGCDALADQDRVAAAVRQVAAKMPTYMTLKDVKKRWGHGQEDVFPVTQFEKLWGDLTALPEVDARFAVVPRRRGQQLKDIAQLDGWLRDGSAAHIESLAEWATPAS